MIGLPFASPYAEISTLIQPQIAGHQHSRSKDDRPSLWPCPIRIYSAAPSTSSSASSSA
jgi:hypothetical protein